MMQMRCKLLIAIVCLCSCVFAQEKFELPTKLDMLPVTYLKTLKVTDVNKQLNRNERIGLCSLFSQAYLVSTKKYGQDYLLNTDAPIYRLFKKNFPEIAAKEGEGGIFLGNIHKFIRGLPEHKAIGKSIRSR